jgi:hypothetical protein
MKTITSLLLLSTLASCAITPSKPPIWRDQYGVIHREQVEPIEVAYVKVLEGSRDMPGGCIKLRNIYLSGRSFKNWELKTETAKMNGTHVIKQYYNGRQDIMGAAYDCTNRRSITNLEQWQKVSLHNGALSEIERRTYDKKKIIKTKDSIPVLNYNGYE